MVIQTMKHYKLHVFIYAILSFCFLIYMPDVFNNRLIAGAISIAVLLNIKAIKFEFSNWYEAILFMVINAYLTLAFSGYDLFLVKSIDTEISVILFLFGLSFIWAAYVFQSALNLIDYLSNRIKTADASSNKKYWQKWLVLFVIMCSVFMLWQRAFNPIVMSPDSWGYIAGWRSGTYNSFRSPVYAFFIYIICSLAASVSSVPEVQWVAFAQIIAFSSLLATILIYFHMKWIRFRWLIPVAIILPLIPSFGLHTIVIWCDLACGMSIMWLTYVLVRVLDEVIMHNTANKMQQMSFCIQLCISLILVFFMRSNSFLVYFIAAPVLALLFLCRKKWKLLTTILISVIMVLLIKNLGYKALVVTSQRTTIEGKYYAGLHDIQAAYYRSGVLSERTRNALMKYIPKLDEPEVKDEFIPDFVIKQDYDLSELTLGEFIFMYTDCFIHNPFKMMKSILYRCNMLWAIGTKSNIYDTNYFYIYNLSTDTLTTYVNEIGVYRQENILTRIMLSYMRLMATSIPVIFIWEFGFWAALMAVSLMTLILQKKFICLLTYLPVFTYLFSLLLTMGWPGYRYGLSVFFVGLFLPLVFILQGKKQKMPSEKHPLKEPPFYQGVGV